ncbi:hypothetical protein DFS34DRAFT_683574 [Phlyctochytrium arcticum]|nr:hypothetical protein DFS34DRAFT_683574 [Phlyctochytrium arcticum]
MMDSASSPLRRRPGAARIPFLILAILIPTLLGVLISSVPTVVDADCVCHPDAPTKLSGFLDQAAGSPNPTTTRVSCNSDVAIYMTGPLMATGRATIGWIVPFYNMAWKFLKETYGGCSVPRLLKAPIGPSCEAFGAPKPLIAQFGLGTSPVSDGWDSWRVRFDPSSGSSRTNYRTWMGQAHNVWSNTDYAIKKLTMNVLCKQVETGSGGVHETPANPIWGEGAFADICSYDFFNKSGMASMATQAYTDLDGTTTSSYPPGGSNARWFRNWYYPLWVEKRVLTSLARKVFRIVEHVLSDQVERQQAVCGILSSDGCR